MDTKGSELMTPDDGMLKYLKHSEIDKVKWDNCVMNAVNPLVYHLSDYLDIVHPTWNGYVLEKSGTYHAIMPLLSGVRKGFDVHAHPILSQQLGLIYDKNVNASDLLQGVLPLLIDQYKVLDYPFNHTNEIHHSFLPENVSLTHESTQILSLSDDYQKITVNYRRDRKSRLKQALKNNLSVVSISNPEIFIDLFKSHVSPQIKGGVDQLTTEKIEHIINWGIDNQLGKLYVVIDQDRNYLSSGYFTFLKDRLTYLFGATSGQGKNLHANTLLLDSIIRQFSKSDYTMDFEGSTVDGIRDFYQSFGTKEEFFPVLKAQNLPPIFQMLLNTRKKVYQLLNS